MNPRVAVIVLVVIVLLFIGGVGLGASHGNDTSTKDGWTTSLEQILVPQAKIVDLQPVPSSCIQADALVTSGLGNCTYAVRDVRRLHIKPTQGAPVITVNQSGVIGTPKLKSDQAYEFDLTKNDTFSVTCVGTASCRLQLE
jgi:hypothetical protein